MTAPPTIRWPSSAAMRPMRKIIDQPNQGHIAACNEGFAASTGDVVIFLDADDLLEPGALMEVSQAWSPDLAKVQFDLMVIDADGKDLGRLFGHFRRDFTVQRVRDDFARTGTYRWPVTTGNAYSRWFVSLLFPQAFEGLGRRLPQHDRAALRGRAHAACGTGAVPPSRHVTMSSKTRASSGLVDAIVVDGRNSQRCIVTPACGA